MYITFKRDELLRPLSHVAGVVERRQTLPILSYVLLRQHNGETTLTGTDLEIEVIAKAHAEEHDTGEMTLPARKLLDICRALPENVVVELKEEKGKVSVKAGKSRFTLLTFPVSDFPTIPTVQWEFSLVLPQEELRNLFEKTHFCMAQQDVRYYLNGLLLEIEGTGIRAVATDGHRLAITKTKLLSELKDVRQSIVPRKGVHEFLRLLTESEQAVTLHISPNHLRAETRTLTFTSKLIDGRYPDYTKVIPATQRKSVNITRADLREALNRAAILSSEKYRGVRLTFADGTLQITAHNPEQEEAEEEISVDYKGDTVELGFNVIYLMEALSAVDSESVSFSFTDPNTSATVRAPDREYPKYVIMPMRL